MTASAAWRRQLGMIAGTVLAIVLIRTFFVQVYGISTPSMNPTLRPGDYVVTSTFPFGSPIPGLERSTPRFGTPRHGDVVVYGEKPGDPPVRIIKRVIGVPGDTIAMTDRRVVRNGTMLDEPYVSSDVRDDEPLGFDGPYGVAWHLDALAPYVPRDSYRPTRNQWGPLVVPPDHYLLLGDDRDGSRDSRVTGFVSREQIRGRVYFVYFSISPGKSSASGPRWSRIGQRVR